MKFGSTIRPELGRMDFSGIERGGRAYAEGIMRGSELFSAGIRSAGASIGDAIQKYQENKAMDAALTGSIETSISLDPTRLAWLQNQEENKTDIGQSYSKFKAGNATRADKMMLTGSLQAMERMDKMVQKRMEAQQDKTNMLAAVRAWENSVPAGTAETSIPLFFENYAEFGGNDPEFAQKFLETAEPTGKAPSLQQGQVYTLPDGTRVKGVFNPETGQTLYSTAQGLQPIPGGATPGEPKMDRNSQIETLMREYNIPRVDAAAIIDGVANIVTDPLSGKASIVNRATGKSREVTFSNPELEANIIGQATKPLEDASNDQKSLWDMANSRTTGIFPALVENLQRITGSAGINIQDPVIAEERQQLINSQQRFIRALSLNSRYPTTEQERLRQEMGLTPSAMVDPQTLRARMSAMNKTLNREIDILTQAVNDPNSPVEQRKADQQSLNDVINFKRILGVPEGMKGSEQPSGVPDEVKDIWEFLTPEERGLWSMEGEQ